MLSYHLLITITFLNSILMVAKSSNHSMIQRISFETRETSTCSDRGGPGLICQECDLMATCVLVNNKWLTIPVESCDQKMGYYCNLKENGCSKAPGPCHPSGFIGNFACTSEGVFPDPYDCQKYHMCYYAGANTLVSVNIECGGNKAFSASTGDCSLKTSDAVCTDTLYTCRNAGDSNAWPGNRNIFYICKATISITDGERILFPTLYRCAAGELFDGENCIAGSNYRPPNNDIISFRCTSQGLHPDITSCRTYYFCNSAFQHTRYACATNTYFDPITKSCMKGNC